jgi:hypothetical protein
MRVKKEYIVLAVVIVALSLVLMLRKNDRTHYRLPELEPVSAKQITRLIISRADSALTLERHGDLWKITPQGYSADTSQVNRMLKLVAGFTLTTLVSEAGNYVPYELDAEKRIGVEALEGDRSVLKVSIGKPASTYQHTFVRLENDPRIYQARENLRTDFDKDVEHLRDKVVLTVEKDYVKGIALIGRDDSLALRHANGASGAVPPAPADTVKSEPGPSWQTVDGTAADEQAVERVIDQLVTLKCDGFISGRAKNDFTYPIFTVRVEGSESVSLSIFDKGEGTRYPAVSSESDFPFYLTEWVVKQIMKKPDELMGKGSAAKPKTLPKPKSKP